MVPGHREHGVGRWHSTARSPGYDLDLGRRDGPDPAVPAGGDAPSLTRLLMSGSTQAFTVRSKPSPKWHQGDDRPPHAHSRAASTLLFPAPITTTRRRQ